MSDSNAILQLRGITRDFKMGAQTVHVLKGIDLDIYKNQYVALMGPSGSGKSTLMNLLGCLDTPTSGSYVLNGSDASALDDNALAEIRNNEIGFVFQTFNLLPRSTALDNVALPLVYAGWGKEERIARAQEVLEQVGLGDRMDHKPNQLSGGQRQRVAVARALVNRPALILADEPTGNLDPILSKELFDLFHHVSEQGTNLIIASHDLDLIRRTRKRVLVLSAGRLADDIPASDDL